MAKYIRSRYPSVHIGPPQTFVAHTKNADSCSAEFKMHDVGLSETVSFCSSHTIETHIERQRFARTLDERFGDWTPTGGMLAPSPAPGSRSAFGLKLPMEPLHVDTR